jgi:hypothetical protein
MTQGLTFAILSCYILRMSTKISMTIPEEDLQLIDEFSGGNRTAFMVGASLERARALRRQAIDDDISRCLAADDLSDLVDEWDGVVADGLD